MKFLVSSDWHFRMDKPRCRVDEDWFGTQRDRARWLVSQINKYECPMFDAGDTIDSGVIPPLLENMLIEEFNKTKYSIYSIAGNHTLLYHSINHLKKGSYWVLNQAKAITHIEGTQPLNNLQGFVDDTNITAFQYGEKMVNGTGIAVCHRLVFPNEPPPYLPSAVNAKDLLDMYDYDIILSGDNHMAFFTEHNGKVLINGGGILRQTADKKYQTPQIFLYEDGVITAIEVPVNIENVQQEYLLEEKDRDNRINTFVERVQVSHDLGLNFVDNVEASLKETPLEDSVVQIIYKALKQELIN